MKKFVLLGKLSVDPHKVCAFYPSQKKPGHTVLLLDGGHEVLLSLPAHEVRTKLEEFSA